MRVAKGLSEIGKLSSTVVTIGTFDGVHLGHRALVNYLVQRKETFGGKSVLITFEPHPRLVLDETNHNFQILTSLSEKTKILQLLNLDVMVVIPFTTEFSKMTGPEFIESVLIKKLQPAEVVVGYDHAFGHNRSGTIETLKQYQQRGVFNLEVFEPFSLDGETVKSTPIRKNLERGDVEAANKLLGREYEVSGLVVKGAGRGHRLSFPTANLRPENRHKMLPGDGIFAARVMAGGEWYPAAVSIGIRPTFSENERTVEAFLLDFDRDIYGENITIQFVKRLRDEIRFDTEDALIEQMNKDVEKTRKYFEQFEILSEE